MNYNTKKCNIAECYHTNERILAYTQNINTSKLNLTLRNCQLCEYNYKKIYDISSKVQEEITKNSEQIKKNISLEIAKKIFFFIGTIIFCTFLYSCLSTYLQILWK